MNILERLLGVFKPQKKIKTKTRKLGHIGVDSGTMMFCDPCYVIKNKDQRWQIPEWKKFHKSELNSLDSDENGAVVSLNKTDFSDGICMNTGFGDGAYEVEIEEGDFGRFGKRVVSAKITFIQPEDLIKAKRDLPKDESAKDFVIGLRTAYAKFGNVLGRKVA